jgi:tetratricopeptide (TPR) repeat protein
LLDQAEKLMARNARFAFDVVYTLVYHGRFAWAKDRLTPVSQRLQGEVSLLSGLIAAGLNRRDEAAQFLDTASRLNYPPSDSPLMLMMAEACFRMNDFARAAAAYQSFLRHATQTAQTAGLDMRLGLCYFALGDHPRAVEQFEKAIKQAPDTPELNYYLASSLIEQKDTERAAAFLKEEIRRAPDSFKALTKLAYLAYLAGDNDSCRTWLEQASAKTQEWFETHLVYGLLLNRLGRYEEAVVRLEEAVRLEPTYPKSYFQLATAYRRTGNETKAAQSMETYQRLLAEQTQRALEAQGRADRPKPP